VQGLAVLFFMMRCWFQVNEKSLMGPHGSSNSWSSDDKDDKESLEV
jgi:hypothetical protein